MTQFKARARNEKDYTFSFQFQHTNWNGVEKAAEAHLAKLVDSDPLHKANGPWRVENIDIGYV